MNGICHTSAEAPKLPNTEMTNSKQNRSSLNIYKSEQVAAGKLSGKITMALRRREDAWTHQQKILNNDRIVEKHRKGHQQKYM